jgi:hypothetical protein
MPEQKEKREKQQIAATNSASPSETARVSQG